MPWNVQSAVLLMVSVLSVFKPVLSSRPSMKAHGSLLMPAKVCEYPFNSKYE